jgi:hypothetical protein
MRKHLIRTTDKFKNTEYIISKKDIINCYEEIMKNEFIESFIFYMY